MAFHFNPSLWFVCKLCREAFPDTDKLKIHKLESHLGESINIKCIVFEEKLLDHEWIPSAQEFGSIQHQIINVNNALPQESSSDCTNIKALISLKSRENVKFKNPYVSLKIISAQEPNSASAGFCGPANSGGTKSRVGPKRSLQFKEEKRKLATKRKLNSANGSSPFPSKQPKSEDSDEHDAHKNKIRELLSNAVIIKSEQKRDSDDRVFLKSEDLPISIVSTYSLPSSSNSKITNPVCHASFNNSLKQQQNQLLLQGNTEGFVQSPLTGFDVANTPEVFKTVPTFLLQPEQNYSYPVIFNVNGQPIQVQGNIGGDSSNIFDSTLHAQPGITSVTNKFTGKVEFVEYDSIAQYPKIEMISSGQPKQIPHEKSDLSVPLESQSTYVRHLLDKKIQKRYICPICSAAFRKNFHLTQHRLTHSNHRPFPCPKCDSKFKTKGGLHRHLISVHGQVSNFRCELCFKFFPSPRELAIHGVSHSDERPCHCDFPNCGAQFKSSRSLYVHTRMKHGKALGFEQFECPICGDTFGLRKYLRLHQKRAHLNSDVQILS